MPEVLDAATQIRDAIRDLDETLKSFRHSLDVLVEATQTRNLVLRTMITEVERGRQGKRDLVTTMTQAVTANAPRRRDRSRRAQATVQPPLQAKPQEDNNSE